MVEPSRRRIPAEKPKPGKPNAKLRVVDDLTDDEDAVLLRRLEVYVRRWKRREPARTAKDRKGAKFFRSQMWEEGYDETKLAITANMGLALFERAVSSITRGAPEPIVQAVNPDDDDAAQIIAGALQTNWRETRMDQLAKSGAYLCGFTRPIGWYVYWDDAARGGDGDVNTIKIPAHRLIVDDEHLAVRDMQFCGFRKPMTRAELTMLFPDHADDIESAGTTKQSNTAPETLSDPLEEGPGTDGFPQVERLVANSSGIYTPVTSVKQGWGGKDRDPLAEKVDVHFLWVKDPTPDEIQVPATDEHGHTRIELDTDEDGNILYDETGIDTVVTVNGPFHQPRIEPRTKTIMETHVVKQYPYWRHVVWIPSDRKKLWDVNWKGPVPIAIQRDTLPMEGFHSQGSALRLCSLGVARNVLLTIIFERLKLSLGGAYLAEVNSGLKANKLVPEAGVVFQVTRIDGVKALDPQPVDAAYFDLLNRIEDEMMKLVGISPVQMGQQAGRADSPATYDTLVEQAGSVMVSRAQMLEQTITDWSEIAMWFIQTRYTHKHIVEVEYPDGMTGFAAASTLATRGTFGVRIETGSTMAHSRSAEFSEAKDAAALGFYALPMLGKMGRVRNWRAALKQKAAIMADPGKAWLLGGAGASADKTNVAARAKQRNHHTGPAK